jgi:hypothetical protein
MFAMSSRKVRNEGTGFALNGGMVDNRLFTSG